MDTANDIRTALLVQHLGASALGMINLTAALQETQKELEKARQALSPSEDSQELKGGVVPRAGKRKSDPVGENPS